MNLVNSSGVVISDVDFRAHNPLTSFPATLQAEDVAPYGYSVVQSSPQPMFSQFYTVVGGTPAQQPDGTWLQTWVQNPVSLAAAQATQAATMNNSCLQQIVAGFSCSALGAAYTYPSTLTDQQNLAASITDSQLAQAVTAGWVANAEVVQTALGVPCSIINVNGTAYMCVQSGTCGATAPAWTTQPGTPITDGTAVWQVWTTEFWCASNNNGALIWAWQPHTIDQIQLVGRVGKATIMAYQAQNAELQAQIAAATTVDAVAAIVWSA